MHLPILIPLLAVVVGGVISQPAPVYDCNSIICYEIYFPVCGLRMYKKQIQLKTFGNQCLLVRAVQCNQKWIQILDEACPTLEDAYVKKPKHHRKKS